MYRRVVDFHAHAFHDKIAEKAARNLNQYYGIPLAGNGRFCYLTQSMKDNHITKMVVHATATKPEQVETINDYVAGLVTKDIIGFGTLHPDYPMLAEELDRIENLGLRGLKFHPIFQGFAIDDPGMYPIYEMAEGRLPILMHVGDTNSDAATPARMAKVLDCFPKLTVIAAHLGGYGEWENAKRFLIGREGLYVDTSSSIRFMQPDEAAAIIRAHGTDRVLFGTDYPLSLHKQELEVFDRLGLTDEENEQILWKNAYRLLKLPVD